LAVSFENHESNYDPHITIDTNILQDHHRPSASLSHPELAASMIGSGQSGSQQPALQATQPAGVRLPRSVGQFILA